MKNNSKRNINGLANLWQIAAGGQIEDEQLDSNEIKSDLLISRLDSQLSENPGNADIAPVIINQIAKKLNSISGKTLRSLLFAPSTEVDTIIILKDYAKKLSRQDTTDSDYAVAIALYYAAIANAIVYHDKKITSHSNHYLLKFYSQMLEKRWLSEDVRTLYTKAKTVLSELV